MNMLEDAAEFLRAACSTSVSVPVVYIRRGGAHSNFKATRGKTIFRAENAYGTIVREVSHDFLVSTECCAFTPESGDQVICNGTTYEVLAPNGEPVWRYSDNFKKIRRIHTKEISHV